MATRECSAPGCSRPARPHRRACNEHSSGGPTRTRRRDGKRHIYLALTEREWVALLDFQNGVCYVCLVALRNRYTAESSGQTAYLDHSHHDEKQLGLRASLRGLLCYNCNRRILVALSDNVEKARRVADYLTSPPARRLFGLELLVAPCL